MSCKARIRPFPDDREVACIEQAGVHNHRGELRDMAYSGSVTEISWQDSDRRTFYGEWPGECRAMDGCVLPLGHHGRCAR